MESGNEDTGRLVESKKKRALGMGLAALLGPDQSTHILRNDGSYATSSSMIVDLLIADVEPNPQQPRKDFDEDSIAQLAISIKQHGVIQPIIVSAAGNKFQLVAGERRYRASKIAGITHIPAIIKPHSNKAHLFEIAVMENIQRQDLSPLEEANAYQALITEFQHTHESLANKLGKSRSHISNMLRLLNLPPAILEALHKGKISIGHAKILLSTTSEHATALLESIMTEDLSVRQLETVIKSIRATIQSEDSSSIKQEDMQRASNPFENHQYANDESDEDEENAEATIPSAINAYYDEQLHAPQIPIAHLKNQMHRVADHLSRKLQTPTALSISAQGSLVIEISCDNVNHEQMLTMLAELIANSRNELA